MYRFQARKEKGGLKKNRAFFTSSSCLSMKAANVSVKLQVTSYVNDSNFYRQQMVKNTMPLLTFPILMQELIVSRKSAFFSFTGTSVNSFPISSPI